MPSRRSVVFGLASLPVDLVAMPAFSQAADTLATSIGDLVIRPVGHAALALVNGPHVIYAAPAKESFAGLPAPTGILVTHAHGDHFDPGNLQRLAGSAPIVATAEIMARLPEALRSRTIVLRNGEVGMLDALPVIAIAAYNTRPDRRKYHPRGVGNGYVLSFGDKTVYIAGDTEDTPEMRALTGIDVAFLPINLPFTMSEEQAADAVRAFRPAIVYPYHDRGSDPQKFKELVGDAAEVRLRDWYGTAVN